MLGPILVGILAAVGICLLGLLRGVLPQLPGLAAVWILGIAGLGALLQLWDRNRRYQGLADLQVSIHLPSVPDSSSRWFAHGIISYLLALFGGFAGSEGAMIEASHASVIRTRSRSARWFEQRRRTDAAMILSSGISAAFGAPFAGVLVPMELGVGGRALSTVVSALSAYLTTRMLAGTGWFGKLGTESFELTGTLFTFHWISWREWLEILSIAALGGALCAAFVRFNQYVQKGFADFSKPRPWLRALVGGILLMLLVSAYTDGASASWSLLEQVMWSRIGLSQASLTFVVRALMFVLVLAAFGTIGIFWPLLVLGGYFGFMVDQSFFSGTEGTSALATFAGGAAFWGAVLGTPIAGALVAFELTHNLSVLLPCLVAGVGARQVREWFKTRALVDKDLEARGVSLIDGRAASVLRSVMVNDAMITDYETVPENEPVIETYRRLLKSRYPFLPVVNSQRQYVGLLTADMIQEGRLSQDPLTSNSPLANLLEAKDLLYRSGFKTPTVKQDDSLSATVGMFDTVPCVPVVDDERKMVGLLFVHNVRLAYDREVARRTQL